MPRFSKSLYDWIQENIDTLTAKELLKQWIGLDEYDNSIDIHNIGYSSNKKYKFKCSICNKIYLKTLNDKTSSTRNSYYCSDCVKKLKSVYMQRIRTSEKNCLNTYLNTDITDYKNRLLKEWTGLDANGNEIDMHDIARFSRKRVEWKCYICNGIFTTRVQDRTRYETICPLCETNNRLIKGKNDLYTWCKNHGKYGNKLLKECKLTDPSEISYGSHREIEWICSNIDCNEHWIASPHNRTSINRTGCPYCTTRYLNNQTSKAEQYIYNKLKEIYPNTENRFKTKQPESIQPIEFDIAIPLDEQKYGYKAACIEYSPTFWHRGRESIADRKRKICKRYNVRLIEIIDDSYNDLQHIWKENYICDNFQYNLNNLDKAINFIIKNIEKER